GGRARADTCHGLQMSDRKRRRLGGRTGGDRRDDRAPERATPFPLGGLPLTVETCERCPTSAARPPRRRSCPSGSGARRGGAALAIRAHRRAVPPVRIYTTRVCPYCFAAKDLLDSKGVAYEEIDVIGDPETRMWLRKATGQRTVPQVFIGERAWGGFTDLRALDQRGELDRLLAAE